MSSTFKRTIENFTCAHCGAEVVGNGYTDHCPKCLWGRHVDNFPGDRENACQGLMEPLGLEMLKGDYTLTYRCEKCGTIKTNKAASEDDLNSYLTAML